jgi:hemolysin type calcium-binding protein
MAPRARPLGALVVASALLALLVPGAAGGATARFETRSISTGQAVSVLVFRADPGERNGLEAVLEPDALRVADSVPLTPGTGCAATTDPNTVRCPLIPGVTLRGADVELGDGVDSALLDRQLNQDTFVKGGPGTDDIHASGRLLGEGDDDILSGGSRADVLRGAAGDDQLFGGPGVDRLEPGRGRDIVQSGAGDDTIAARDGAFDRIACGGGRDTVTMDKLDFPGETCFDSKLDRRGAPRATPLDGTLALSNRLRLGVACPADFPRACRGTVTARLGRRLVGRRRFRVARGTRGASAVRPSRRQLGKIRRATRFGLYRGRLIVTVRARGRTVRARVPLNVDGR